jgi:hypothetical protein
VARTSRVTPEKAPGLAIETQAPGSQPVLGRGARCEPLLPLDQALLFDGVALAGELGHGSVDLRAGEVVEVEISND